jgi:NTP pyrophosphatase (non-canonical NTP hydrolase)
MSGPVPADMKLYEMMQLQTRLMDDLGIKLHRQKGVDVYHPHFVAACIGLASEAIEVLDEINVVTRPWAEKPEAEVQDAIAKEAIDAFFYLLEIFIMLGIGPHRIYRLYEAKWKKNMARSLAMKLKNSWSSSKPLSQK